MTRPCFLVVDREYSGSISTRKLVIETAKLNVITAYSGTEGLETFERFPLIDGLVVDASMKDISCEAFVRQIKQRNPDLPVIVIGTPFGPSCDEADHFLHAFDPSKLLALLRDTLPQVSRVMERESDQLATIE